MLSCKLGENIKVMLLPSDNPFLLPLPDLNAEDAAMLEDILPKDLLTEGFPFGKIGGTNSEICCQ